MPRYLQTLCITGFVALIAILSIAAIRHNREVGERSLNTLPNQEYVNTSYGFSFSYPPQYRLSETTGRSIELQNADMGTRVAEVSVEIAEGDDTDSFSDFAHRRASLVCDKFGASCPLITRSEGFASASGASGEVFYLEYREFSGGATTTREAGPYFAFNLSSHVPEEKFVALLVYPSHPAEETPLYDAGVALAHSVAQSLQLAMRSR